MSVKHALPIFLIVCLMLGSLSVLSVVSADAPWLDGWNNRLSFYIQGGTPLNASEPVQVQLTVLNQTGTNTVGSTTFYLPDLTQDDFEDLRVTAIDGLTLYPEWNESTNVGVNCTFWVKVPSVNASYYLYCSNLNAAYVWDKAATFVDVVGGVVGAWNMEEALATDPVKDWSANSNDGAAIGTTMTDGRFTGKNGRQFNGTSDKITLGTFAYNFSGTNNISFFAWLKPTTQTNDYPVWFSCERLTPTRDGYGLFSPRIAVERLTFSRYVSGVTVSGANINCAFDGTWYCYMGTYDGTNKNLTVNSNTASVGDSNSIPVFTIAPTIGTEGTSYYKGVISNFIIFSVCLTTAQKTNLYANYPDVSLDEGNVLVRNYVYSVPVVGAFGTLEYYVEPTPSPSPIPDITAEDAVGLASVAVVFAVALPCAFLMMRRKNENDD